MRRVSILTAIALAALVLGTVSCVSWEETIDTFDPDPKVDLTGYKMDDPNQRHLALLFTPVDEELNQLIRFIGTQDNHPNEEWFDLLFRRFTWIEGSATVDTKGEVLFRKPDKGIKPLNAIPLVNYKGDWRSRSIKSYVDYTEFGPQLYLATPIFQDTDWVGLLIVYFDPRVLLSFTPNSEELIIIDPWRAVWTESKVVDEKALLDVPWSHLLTDEVEGEVRAGGKFYTFFARYIGHEQIVYAVENFDGGEPDSWFWWFD